MRSGTWDHQGNYVPKKNTTTLLCTDMLLSFSTELNTFWVYLFPLLMLTCKVSGTNACFRELFTTWRTKGKGIDMPGEITYGQQCFEFLAWLHLSPFSVWCCPFYWCSVTICRKVGKWLWIKEHGIAIWHTITPGHHKWKIMKWQRHSLLSDDDSVVEYYMFMITNLFLLLLFLNQLEESQLLCKLV